MKNKKNLSVILVTLLAAVIAGIFTIRGAKIQVKGKKKTYNEVSYQPTIVKKTVNLISFESKDAEFPDFFYCHTDSVATKVIVDSSEVAMIEREHALCLSWDLEKGEYFGWGINFKKGTKGINLQKAKYLKFYIKGEKGNETFHVKLKDLNENEQPIISTRFFTTTDQWQEVKIPIEDFVGINNKIIENFNIGFDKNCAEQKGKIYLDDFWVLY